MSTTRQRLEAVTRTEGRGNGNVQSPRAKRGAKGVMTCTDAKNAKRCANPGRERRNDLYERQRRKKQHTAWMRGRTSSPGRRLYASETSVNVELCTRHGREVENLYERQRRKKQHMECSRGRASSPEWMLYASETSVNVELCTRMFARSNVISRVDVVRVRKEWAHSSAG